MPKYKILIADKELTEKDWDYWCRNFSPLPIADGHFESRAEATRFYNALIQKAENDIKKAEETLDVVVENGHIVEVEENG